MVTVEGNEFTIGVTIIAGAFLGIAYYYLSTSKRNPLIDTGSDEMEKDLVLKQGFAAKHVPKGLDLIVVGSGMGGLTTAALMAKEGKKVLVLEQHDVAGGNTHVFEEDGYEFDTGLHYIGGKVGEKSSPTRRLFDHCTDNGVEWEKMDDEYDVAIFKNENDKRYPMSGDIKKLIGNLKREFPGETEVIDKYFGLIRQVKYAMPAFFMSRLMPRFLRKMLSPILGKFLWMFHETTQSVLEGLTDNKKLIGVLTYLWGDFGDEPARSAFIMQALIIDHYRGGGYYPVGGPSQIAYHMTRVIERAGGKVLVRAPVTSIEINENGVATGVRVKDKVIIRAKQIVSSIGAPQTFKKLIPAVHSHRVEGEIKALGNPKIASNLSLSSLFVGIEGDAKELELPKHNIWYLPSPDHKENCEKFKADENEDFPAIFVSFSSVKDPTYKDRCPGKQVCLVIGPTHFETVEQWKEKRVKHRGKDYEAYKEGMKARFLEEMLKLFPQLKGKVNFTMLGTPVTNDYYLGTYRGAVYGLGHTPERFQQDWLTPKTPIQNLYMTGQDVLTCGIVGGAASGLLTSCALSTKFLLTTAPKLA